MPKYGRGLNCEIAMAVQQGLIVQPFNIADIKRFVQSRNWIIPDTYLNVCLANGASTSHSPTYKKYFEAAGNGTYVLSRS